MERYQKDKTKIAAEEGVQGFRFPRGPKGKSSDPRFEMIWSHPCLEAEEKSFLEDGLSSLAVLREDALHPPPE